MLKELGSDDTVKTILSAAVTVGIADKLGAAAEWNNYNRTFGGKLATNLATGTATGLADTINGGSLKDGLEKSILNALVQTGHMEVSSQIKGLDKNYLAHKIAHAVAGCAAGAANRGSCTDGAIGAAVGEIVGDALVGGRTRQEISDAEYHKILSYSKIVAGSVAALNGGDVDAAANAAQVAVVNNALKWTSTTATDIQKEAEQRKKQDDWISILLPAHAAVLSKEDGAADLSNFRGGLRNISLSGAIVSGYSPVVLVGGKRYFMASGVSVAQGAAILTLIEGQPYRVSDLAYDASLGVLINRATGKMVTWANTDNKAVQRYLKTKGGVTNYVLGKGASETISHVLKDKNTVLIEVPEWRKSK